VDPAWFRVVAPMVVVALALGGALWVSRRRERAADDVSLAYEELTRTATINALAGASIAMLGEFATGVASLPREGQQLSGWLLLLPMLVGWLGIGIWIGCGTKLVFRNRRIDALRAAA
jgi:Zn-dependent protease with chaperone function